MNGILPADDEDYNTIILIINRIIVRHNKNSKLTKILSIARQNLLLSLLNLYIMIEGFENEYTD